MHAIRAARAFDGVRFVDGGATVLVDGGRILGVGSGACDLPDGTAVSTYDGTLLPGLVDGHVHLVAASALPGTPGSLEWAGSADAADLDAVIATALAAHAAAGVTTVRDLGDKGYRTLHHRDRPTPGQPRIVAAGPPVTVRHGHCHYLGGVVEGAAGREAAVAERVERGVDVVKVMASGGFLTPGSDAFGAQFTVEELRDLVERAHGSGLPVVAHAHSRLAAQVATVAGVDGIEHFTCLAPGRAAATDDLLDAVAAAGTTIGPTLGVDVERFPPRDQVPPHLLVLMESVGMADVRDHVEQRRFEAGRLWQWGIRVVSGLDAGAGPGKPHGDLWRAVADIVLGGWPVAAAVATATSVPAEECGVPTGRLEAGLDADLLVVEGDLAADVTALARPVAVWVRGVPVVAVPQPPM
jgi:imidazolonepropionase-like amidohydrolase